MTTFSCMQIPHWADELEWGAPPGWFRMMAHRETPHGPACSLSYIAPEFAADIEALTAELPHLAADLDENIDDLVARGPPPRRPPHRDLLFLRDALWLSLRIAWSRIRAWFAR